MVAMLILSANGHATLLSREQRNLSISDISCPVFRLACRKLPSLKRFKRFVNVFEFNPFGMMPGRITDFGDMLPYLHFDFNTPESDCPFHKLGVGQHENLAKLHILPKLP